MAMACLIANVNRKAKDTDYLLITEDMKTYGCGCCSIGLGEFKLRDFSLAVLLARYRHLNRFTNNQGLLLASLFGSLVNPCRQVGRFKLEDFSLTVLLARY